MQDTRKESGWHAVFSYIKYNVTLMYLYAIFLRIFLVKYI